MTTGRLVQLVASCAVLALGVVLLLRAALGSDGYSTLVNGLSLSTGVAFVVVNAVVGLLLVALAWARGLTPGIGTLVQPLVVGVGVSAGLGLLDEPSSLGARVLLLVLAVPVLSVGVAGYLNTATGAGPMEAAVLAFDPPVPFRYGYGALQAVGALVGWACGADVGVGTLVVVLALGPLVDALRRVLPRWETPAATV